MQSLVGLCPNTGDINLKGASLTPVSGSVIHSFRMEIAIASPSFASLFY